MLGHKNLKVNVALNFLLEVSDIIQIFLYLAWSQYQLLLT